MIELCFGTVFTLLCQGKNSTSQPLLYKCLVTPNDESDIEPDKGSVGNRKAGKEDISQISKDFFLQQPIKDITAFYRVKLSKYIKEQYYAPFVLAIKRIMESSSLDENTIIGIPAYTKSKILTADSFDFFEFLAALMKYISNLTNSLYQNSIAEIPNHYLDSLVIDSQYIHFENHVYNIPTKLEYSILDIDFTKVFTEVNQNCYSLELINPSNLKIYRLKIANNNFDLSGISDFVYHNIGRYVFSRSKRKDLVDRGYIDTIASDAIQQIKNNPKFDNQADNFGEIMLYSFLECSLHAPKIMSGFEVANNRINKSKSAGIYLLPAGAVNSNNQIVFGCSKAVNNIKDAVNDVLTQAVNIISNETTEIKLLDPSILNNILDDSTATFVERIIEPQEEDNISTDKSFGIFVSSSIKVENKSNISNWEYKQKLEQQMDEDIRLITPYLQHKIHELNLQNYSIHLFILPLDDAENDSDKIMNYTFGGAH